MARIRTWRGLLITVLAFAVLVLSAYYVTNEMSRRAMQDGAEIVRSAVERAALTCYAVEGRYPQSIGYLTEHYALSYDREMYLVSYDAFASNVFPDISVSLRGEKR